MLYLNKLQPEAKSYILSMIYGRLSSKDLFATLKKCDLNSDGFWDILKELLRRHDPRSMDYQERVMRVLLRSRKNFKNNELPAYLEHLKPELYAAMLAPGNSLSHQLCCSQLIEENPDIDCLSFVDKKYPVITGNIDQLIFDFKDTTLSIEHRSLACGTLASLAAQCSEQQIDDIISYYHSSLILISTYGQSSAIRGLMQKAFLSLPVFMRFCSKNNAEDLIELVKKILGMEFLFWAPSALRPILHALVPLCTEDQLKKWINYYWDNALNKAAKTVHELENMIFLCELSKYFTAEQEKLMKGYLTELVEELLESNFITFHYLIALAHLVRNAQEADHLLDLAIRYFIRFDFTLPNYREADALAIFIHQCSAKGIGKAIDDLDHLIVNNTYIDVRRKVLQLFTRLAPHCPPEKVALLVKHFKLAIKRNTHTFSPLIRDDAKDGFKALIPHCDPSCVKELLAFLSSKEDFPKPYMAVCQIFPVIVNHLPKGMMLTEDAFDMLLSFYDAFPKGTVEALRQILPRLEDNQIRQVLALEGDSFEILVLKSILRVELSLKGLTQSSVFAAVRI